MSKNNVNELVIDNKEIKGNIFVFDALDISNMHVNLYQYLWLMHTYSTYYVIVSRKPHTFMIHVRMHTLT
jgi:hypothetical protein